VIHRCQRL